jgi:hypothetical protein
MTSKYLVVVLIGLALNQKDPRRKFIDTDFLILCYSKSGIVPIHLPRHVHQRRHQHKQPDTAN